MTSFEKEILKLTRKGFTLREIGDQLGCSHQTVKRHLEKHKPKKSKTDTAVYEWSSGEFLTRSQVMAHLRQFARDCGWHKRPKEQLRQWIEQVLEALARPDGKDEVGLLLITGPVRPGRPVESASGILRNENEWNMRRSRFKVWSSMGRHGFPVERISITTHKVIR